LVGCFFDSIKNPFDACLQSFAGILSRPISADQESDSDGIRRDRSIEVGVDALVNMSQMTVSQMSIRNTTSSRQQRKHWLSEQALAWSGLPVVTVRPTMFLESFLPFAGPAVRDRDRIDLPFGQGKTNPVAAADVARVVAAVLADPWPHLGRKYELTGPRSQDMHGVAGEFSDVLNRQVAYSDIAPEDWEAGLKREGLPEHLIGHLVAMGELHRAGRYDGWRTAWSG
jgi:NAD(P)H dehydrogenase (quinone)